MPDFDLSRTSILGTPAYFSPMKFCKTSAGKQVAYNWVGEKAPMPLVLLHGFCEDHLVWSPLKTQLKHPLLWIDLPGFGQSDLPLPADMSTHAAAVMAVLEAENIDQCVLVGHSMGGYVALEFASKWPERLVGLGLFHSHPFVDSEERKTARQRGIETLAAGKRDLYVAQLFPNLFEKSFLEHNADTLNDLIVNGKKQSAAGISAALQAMLTRRDHQETLSQTVQCPVLFLLGKQDTLVPPDQGLKAAMLPLVAEVQLLPEAAHMAMYECPEETAVILNSFWDFCVGG